MRMRVLAFVWVVGLVVGCSPLPPVVEPPATPVRKTSDEICRPTPRGELLYARREELLLAALQENLEGTGPAEARERILPVANCLEVEQVEGGNQKMLIVRLRTDEPSTTRMYGVAVWLYRGAWRSASLLEDGVCNGVIVERLQEDRPSLGRPCGSEGAIASRRWRPEPPQRLLHGQPLWGGLESGPA